MKNTGFRGDRRGAALVIALLLLVILDCIIIGTLQLSLQEHRLGANGSVLLQLRLDAESGLRRALAVWSLDIDSMLIGGEHSIAVPRAGTGPVSVDIERLHDRLFLIRSVAAEPAPRAGRVAARLLVVPPALPPGTDPAPAPLSSAGIVRILPTGVIDPDAAPGCAAGARAHYAILMTDPLALIVDAGAQPGAAPGSLSRPSIAAALDRVTGLIAGSGTVGFATADTVIAADAAGALIVLGDLSIRGGATFRGLIIARGVVTLESGSFIRGAVHTGGGAVVGGEIQWDPCAVADAVAVSGLDKPLAAGARGWLPTF